MVCNIYINVKNHYSWRCTVVLSSQHLAKIYECRPFKTRNADEFDLSSVLDLFVDPTDGLKSPFDFENAIIKGRMGSGKTMYLRANYAYYLYTVVPCLLNNTDVILPIYIRLSDFQNIPSTIEIYNKIIIKIIQEMTTAYLNFKDTKKLANLHNGIQTLSLKTINQDEKIQRMLVELGKLTSDEYVEKSTKIFNGKLNLPMDFCNLSAEYNKQVEFQLKKKPNAGIEDLIAAYNTLLRPFNGSVLILIDEAGSINKSFFKEQEDVSMFETLMNQLRTLNFIRTKIAIYPQTYSDILLETRYGDAIILQEDIRNNKGYINFENRCISLIEKYIENFSAIKCKTEEIFDIETERMDVLEQLINASDGNMRRFVHLVDSTLHNAFKENHGMDKVMISHVYSALREDARSLEQLFSNTEIDFLDVLSSTCKARSTYKFRFPNKSIDLHRYINKSSEYNIIKLVEPGSGRKGTVYGFDYAYSIYKEIPTHNIKDTDRIDKQRSKETGQWINKITTIDDNIIEHSKIHKIEGKVDYVSEDNSGFIIGDDNNRYFFNKSMIIDNDKNKKIHIGTRMRFLPYAHNDSLFAYYTEILS